MKSPLPRRELLRRHWLDIIANLLVVAFVWSEPRFRSISSLSKGSSPRFSLANLSVTGHSPCQPVVPVRRHLSLPSGALPAWYRVLRQHWRPYLSSLPSLKQASQTRRYSAKSECTRACRTCLRNNRAPIRTTGAHRNEQRKLQWQSTGTFVVESFGQISSSRCLFAWQMVSARLVPFSK